MQQASLCSGWAEWVESLTHSERWRNFTTGPQAAPLEDTFRAVVGERERLQDRTWPSGDCVRCVDLEDQEAADRVRVYESVRFSCTLC